MPDYSDKRKATAADLTPGATVFTLREGEWRRAKVVRVAGDALSMEQRTVWLRAAWIFGGERECDFFGFDLWVPDMPAIPDAWKRRANDQIACELGDHRACDHG